MTLEFVRRSGDRALPGHPTPYFLAAGEGEKTIVIDSLFTILLSSDESEGKYGMFVIDGPAGDTVPTHSHNSHHEAIYVVRGGITIFLEDADGTPLARELGPGDFGFVPAGQVHTYRLDQDQSRVLGACSPGYERFFQSLGEATDADTYPATPLAMPSAELLAETSRRFDTTFFERRLDT
jgi:quercetin 2,3-dioxygenase